MSFIKIYLPGISVNLYESSLREKDKQWLNEFYKFFFAFDDNELAPINLEMNLNFSDTDNNLDLTRGFILPECKKISEEKYEFWRDGIYNGEINRLDKKRWKANFTIFYSEPKVFLNSILQSIMTVLLPELGGVLFHSAAVCYNNKAIVFSGQSGAGKTTGSDKLVEEMDKLNLKAILYTIDLGVILPIKTIPYYWIIPGEKSSASCFNALKLPLDFIIYPQKSETVELINLSSIDKVAFMLPNIFRLTGLDNKQQLLDICLQLSSIKMYKLKYNKDKHELFPIIDKLI